MRIAFHSAARHALLATVLTLGVTGAASAADTASTTATSAATRAEIDHLLEALQTSGCSFQRNGRWHDAGDARKHLARKRDYIEKRTAITSTEAFISEAASHSSVSGKPYQVRCGTAEPVTSALWLQRALDDYRRRATR